MRRLLGSQLRRNFTSGVAATAIGLAVTAVSYPLYLRFLNYEQYGLWLVLSTLLFATQLLKSGTNPALLKLIAEDFSAGDLDGVRRYLSTVVMLLFATGLPIALGLTLARRLLAQAFGITGANERLFLKLLPWVMLLALYSFLVDSLNSAIAGMGRIDISNYSQAGAQVLALTAGTLLVRAGAGIEGLLIGVAVSYAVMHLVTGIYLGRLASFSSGALFVWDSGRARRIARMGGWVAGGTLLNLLFDPLNRMVLARFQGLAAVPVYDIAYTGGMKLRSLAELATRTLTPEVSRLRTVDADAPRKIRKLNHRTLLTVLALGLAGIAVIEAFARPLLQLWLGGRFQEGLVHPVQWMMLGVLASACGIPGYYTLIGLGQGRDVLYCYFAQTGVSLLSIGAWLWLLPPLTVSKIVIGTALGMLAATMYLQLATERELRRMGVSQPLGR